MISKEKVTIIYRGVKLTVKGNYYKGCPAVMYLRNGDPGDPEELPEFDIDTIEVGGVDIFELLDGASFDTKKFMSDKPENHDMLQEIADLAIAAMEEDEADGYYEED